MKTLADLIPDVVEAVRREIIATAHDIVDGAPVRQGTLRGSVAVGKNSQPEFTGEKDPLGNATKAAISSQLPDLNIDDQVQIAVTAPYAGWVEINNPFTASALENWGNHK